MNLLVDVGNSRIKWACHDEDGVEAGERADYNKADFAAWAHVRWGKVQPPRHVLVSNVAGGGVAEQLSAWVIRRWQVTPEFLVPEKQSGGVTCAYADPQQLGADRWACLLAARAQFSGPVCIVDCGTAITIDVLADTGEHLGGLILPGIQMMRQSLGQNTAQIPNGTTSTNDIAPDIALGLGRSTQEAVENGCFYSTIAIIERVIADVGQSLNGEMTTVVTGGDADRVKPLLTVPAQKQHDMVLQGLAVLSQGLL